MNMSNQPISDSLNEILDLAIRTDSDKIVHWVHLELGGYYENNPFVKPDDNVPDYRTIRIVYQLENGRQVFISDDKLGFVNNYPLRFSVREMEEMAQSHTDSFIIPDPPLVKLIQQYMGVNVVSLVFQKVSMMSVLDTIRMMALSYKTQLASTLGQPAHDLLSSLNFLHPKVHECADELIASKHYRNAVLDVYIALIEEVKKRSGVTTADGKGLMQHVFSANRPILRISTDPDEQEGFMHLFEGAIQAIRNPKAHSISIDTTFEEALQWLAFASSLFRRLDQAVLQQKNGTQS
ncbi:TIGR02391 family protein [Sulfobacillus thermotolerans]|uniref:TIGR02391 family protein n=1 Tax=Sulfobacillus thermotolerans TaxID=338644 RepID=A0ABN5GX02_9FIRM|nr:TIGR02391 family protein [Sulfobacillus thermotolerans]